MNSTFKLNPKKVANQFTYNEENEHCSLVKTNPNMGYKKIPQLGNSSILVNVILSTIIKS